MKSKIYGVDLGINFLVTIYGSDGKTHFESGREIKQKRGEYKALRKDLQKKGTPSARRRLKKIGSRENRWMQDVIHCESKALVERAKSEKAMIVLENLKGVRNATEKVRVKDRYVWVSWPFFDFRKKVEYKAARAGVKVLIANPQHTSERCPVEDCRYLPPKKKGQKKRPSSRNRKLHLFTCRKCGYRSNDDRVAAINLHHIGNKYLRKSGTKYASAVASG